MSTKFRFIFWVLAVYAATVVLSVVTLLVFAALKPDAPRPDQFLNGFTAFNGQTSSGARGQIKDLVPTTAPTLGPATASITIVEFADLECPYCRAAVYPVRQLLAAYPNDVRLVFRHFPISSVHPLAEVLAQASMCAHDQGRFWAFHDRLYQEQESMSYNRMIELARSVGVDVDRLERCIKADTFDAAIRQDFTDAVALGGRGTPTWIVNGQKIEGALPFETWKTLIEKLLAQ